MDFLLIIIAVLLFLLLIVSLYTLSHVKDLNKRDYKRYKESHPGYIEPIDEEYKLNKHK